MDYAQLSEAREQLAALHARSAHSEDNRRYITDRLDLLYELLRGSNGIMPRLTRLEEKLDHLEKREARHLTLLGCAVPIVAVAAQYILGLF